jgi:hypothetical protein
MHFRWFGFPFAGLISAGLLNALLAGCESGSATAVSRPPSAADPSDSNAVEAVTDASATQAGRPKLRPGANTKVLAAAGDKPYDKTFDDLRFDIKLEDRFHQDMLPEEIAAMFGQRIRIRGFILPTAQRSGVKEFVLVRDNQECCFGPGAALYDCIFVQMKGGATTEFSIRPVAVEGTFGLKQIFGPDGRHLAIYHLEADSVR